MIREATMQDMPALLEMAREYHKKLDPPWPYSGVGVRRFLEAVINSPDGLVLIHKGFLVGIRQANPLSPKWIVASEILWWGNADLFRHFRKWAQGANEIRYSCPPDVAANKLFQRIGKPVEAVYSEVETCV